VTREVDVTVVPDVKVISHPGVRCSTPGVPTVGDVLGSTRYEGEETTMTDMWTYRDSTWTADYDLVGYDVEATDGSIGSIDEATKEAASSYLVVDTGFWSFGKKRLIPAGMVSTVDHDARKVHVSMTKEQVKAAPDYEREAWNDDTRLRYSDYYDTYSRR
jgi:hypothetical protein